MLSMQQKVDKPCTLHNMLGSTVLNLYSLCALKFHRNSIISQTFSSLSLIYIIKKNTYVGTKWMKLFSRDSRDNKCNELCIQNQTEKKIA